jgi:hypothetical protein
MFERRSEKGVCGAVGDSLFEKFLGGIAVV